MATKKKLIITAIISIIAILLILIALGMWVIQPYYSNQIDIVEKPNKEIKTTSNIEIDNNITTDIKSGSDSIYKEENKEDEIINIIVCGMDARNYDTNSRSDTIMLVSYNTTKNAVKLVSIMRDTWVNLTDRGWNKINSATAYGGTGLLINTVNENFDLDIQYYVQIKFDDFKTVINALDGIEVSLHSNEISYINNKLHSDDNDWKNDIKGEAGIIKLNGTQALWHCRNRSIGNSDFERTERQRDVMSSIINKAVKMNIGQASKLMLDLRDEVKTNIPIDILANLCKEALITGNMVIETDRLPYDDMFTYGNKNGASVIEIDLDKTTNKLHSFLGYDTKEGTEGTEKEQSEAEKKTNQAYIKNKTIE